MNQNTPQFTALHQLTLEQERITRLKINVLVPMMQNPTLLTHYADNVIQEQKQLLLSQPIQSGQELSHIIQTIIEKLNQSKKYLKPNKTYNAIQRWFGIDLEQQAGSIHFLNELQSLIDKATLLSHRIATEIYHSQKQMQDLQQLRNEMAHYVVAAEQFLTECDGFAEQPMSLDSFKQRLDKKINTLMTSQSATDMAMLQMILSQNVAMTILDRFNEAKNLLIPAWQQHVFNVQSGQTPQQLQQLNDARERLISTLDKAVKSSNP